MQSITEEIMGKVRDLVPVLADRHEDCVAMRDLPHATFEDFKRQGLLNLLAPKRFGGRETPYAAFSRAVQTMTWGCASSAWVFSVWNEHAWILAGFEERAQLDVWAMGPERSRLRASHRARLRNVSTADGR